MTGRRAFTRPARLALVVTLLSVLLSACVSIPTSGRVLSGGEVRFDGARAALRVAATGPLPGAAPEEIVEGFLAAVAGLDDYAVAREFLAPVAQAPWRPSDRTVIHAGPAEVQSLPPSADGTRTVSVVATVEATIDDSGRWTQETVPSETTEQFEVGRVDGQWRITSLPQGVLVSAVDADRVLTPYAVYFPDPTRTYLVPDVRWFPQLSSAATPLVRALLGGPSGWLLGAVDTSSVPPGTQLELPTVPVEDGVAVVDLSEAVLGTDADQLALLQLQLDRTLRAVPGVVDVELRVADAVIEEPESGSPGLALRVDPTVDNRPLVLGLAEGTDQGGAAVPGSTPEASGEASAAPSPEPPGVAGEPGSRPVAADGAEVLRLGLGGSEVVPGSTPLSQAISTGLAAAPDGGTLAGLNADRTELFVQREGGAAVAALAGTALTTPSFDAQPFDWLWTATAATAQDDRPRVLVVGNSVEEVEVGWLRAGDEVRALRVSRDGTRAVLVVADVEGAAKVLVAGIRRDPAGRPTSLSGLPLSVAVGLSDAVDVAWVTADEVVVLGRTGEEPLRPVLAQVGGSTTALAPTPQAATVTSGFGERNIVVGTAQGTILTRSGGQWVTAVTSGVSPTFPG